MQVNSVSNLSATSKASFGRGREDYQRMILESFAKADDASLKQSAVQIASAQVNDKKHNRITNGLFWAIPLVAGLSAAVAVTGGRIPMLKQFVKTAATWAGSFAAVDLVLAGKKGLTEKSEGVRNFDRKHPVLSTIATFAATLGGLFAGGALVNKAMSKFGPKVIAQAKKLKVDKFLKESKVVNKAADLVKKVPSSIKSVGKSVLSWGPLMLALTSIGHSINHSKVKTAQAYENYSQLKATQAQVRQALAAERSEEA